MIAKLQSSNSINASMAPPTLLRNRTEIELFLSSAKYCDLTSLVQNVCHFNGYDYTCVPFKRLFKECLLNKKLIRIEITDSDTNSK